MSLDSGNLNGHKLSSDDNFTVKSILFRVIDLITQ